MNYDNQGSLDGIITINGDNIETSSISVETAIIKNLSYSNCSGTSLQGNTIIGNVASFNTVNGTNILSDGIQNFICNTGYKITTGKSNTFFGNIAGGSITTGSYNCGVGTGVLRLITTAGYNTGTGYFSLYNTTTGTYNTAIGVSSGRYNITGAYNTFLGSLTDISGVWNSSTAIGYNSKITASNQIVLGTATETTYIAGNAFIIHI